MTPSSHTLHFSSKVLLTFVLALCTVFVNAQSRGVDLILKKGDAAMDTNPKQALNIYQDAANQLTEASNKEQQATVYHKLGTTSLQIGYYPKAISELKSALTLYQELGEDSIVAELFSELGSAYYFGEIKGGNEAETYFQQAHDAFQKIGLYASAEFNANYLGYIYWAKGEKEKALAIHQQCLTVFDSLDNLKGRTTCCSDIGFTLNSLGRYKEALDYNLTALELANNQKDPKVNIPILNNIAISHLHLGNLKQAEKYSQLSLGKAKELSMNLRVKEALSTLHDIYAQMGDFEFAYTILLQLKEVNDALQDIEEIRKLTQQEEQATFALRQAKLAAKQLEKDAIAKTKLNHEKDRNIALLIGLIMISLIALLLILNIKSRVKSSKLLSDKNTQLEEKNEELEALLDELKRTQSKLIQYEKLASLGVLTSGVAHEINNPLNFLKSGIYALDELIENLPTDENQDLATTVLDHMNTGLERITYVVGELNRFGQNSISKDLVNCDIHQIIDNCLRILKPKVDPEICNFQLKFSPENIVIKAHEGSLHQAFTNVIFNSILSIETSGVITISTKKIDAENVEIKIEDTGCGMSLEVLNHAFDPFFTTRPAGEGTGLGLYVSYKLVTAHKGIINLESTENVGTVCSIVLPIN